MILCLHTDTTGQNLTKRLDLHFKRFNTDFFHSRGTDLIYKWNLQAGENKQTKNAHMVHFNDVLLNKTIKVKLHNFNYTIS